MDLIGAIACPHQLRLPPLLLYKLFTVLDGPVLLHLLSQSLFLPQMSLLMYPKQTSLINSVDYFLTELLYSFLKSLHTVMMFFLLFTTLLIGLILSQFLDAFCYHNFFVASVVIFVVVLS